MLIHPTRHGFTLIEMIVVITIIMMLLGIAIFPYRYYMERGYSERASDGLHQEWILAHQVIRSGLQFDINKHAGLFFVFEKGKSTIQSYLLSGSILPDIHIPDITLHNTNIIQYKTFTLDAGVEILGFSGSISQNETKVGYLISPPLGEGVFFTGVTDSGVLLDARIIVGYRGADISSGRAREVLLRPYLR